MLIKERPGEERDEQIEAKIGRRERGIEMEREREWRGRQDEN